MIFQDFGNMVFRAVNRVYFGKLEKHCSSQGSYESYSLEQF